MRFLILLDGGLMMATKVKLTEIVDGLMSQSMELKVFINRETGEVVHMLFEFLMIAEDGESIDETFDWQQEMMLEAHDIIENDQNYINLEIYAVHDYSIMEKFCMDIEDPTVSNDFLHVIKGKGAFSRFRDLLHEMDITEHWYQYRDEAYEQIAKKICDREHLIY